VDMQLPPPYRMIYQISYQSDSLNYISRSPYMGTKYYTHESCILG